MDNNRRDNFKAEIAVKKDKQKEKILEIKRKYENNEIFEKDMTDKEMKELIKIYQEQITDIDNDIKSRKLHISQMLKKLKK